MWNYEDIRSFFIRVAESSKRRLREISEKAVGDDGPAYKILYDDCLSRLNVYSYLNDRSFLVSCQHLQNELRRLLDNPVSIPEEAYDGEVYRRCWKTHIKGLMALCEKNNTGA